jgi:transcriptional regulator with XRE-family HTH domain
MEIRNRRVRLRVTQHELARLAGTSQAAISRLERKVNTPSPITAYAIEEALQRLENDNDPPQVGR